MRTFTVRSRGWLWGTALLALLAGVEGIRSADEPAPTTAAASRPIDGRELFAREWIPGDKRSHGGDGLGPLFNESSCVACHNQGGIGGGGPASKNAQLLTAFPSPPVQVLQANPFSQPRSQPQPQTIPEQIFRGLFGNLDQTPAQPQPALQPQPPRRASADTDVFAPPQAFAPPLVAIEPRTGARTTVQQPFAGSPGAPLSAERLASIEKERKGLASLHPGLAVAPSVVLHRSATYGEYESWRQRLATNGNVIAQPFVSESVILLNGVERVITSGGGIGSFEIVESTAPTQRPQLASQTRSQGQQLAQLHKQEAQSAAQRRLFNQATQHGNFAIVRSERNTTALFGAGLIDAVTDDELRALEARQAAGPTNGVSGRVAALKDGRIGRFGWKAQTPHLHDFVLTACAVELGLNVPDHAQASLPHKPDYKPAGLDLNDAECRALVDYVRDLPAPKQRPLADETDTAFVAAGRKAFEKVGCAECHVPDVGKAVGLYSDLLLHDMGAELGDSGSSYGINVPDSTPEGSAAPQGDLVQQKGDAPATPKIVGATRQEWRTPPLWGVRDSAPYLHDGRAESLDQAIAFHGGEAARSSQQYFNLTSDERFQLITFLKSLVAPETQPVVAR